MKRPLTITVLTAAMILVAAAAAIGDGLAVGVAAENIGTVLEGGAVNVLYGNAGGLTDAGSQMWNQNTAGIPGMAEELDRFGRTLASGDFNGDGRGDLVIGVPWEGVNDILTSGLVHVLYADGSGALTAVGTQWWYQSLNGLPGTPHEGDHFGASLATGDFDGDGFDDLAIGVNSENVGGCVHSGAVHVLVGSIDGLTSIGNQFWTQDSPGVDSDPGDDEHFGDALTSGDFNGDGFADLAVGVPGEIHGGHTNAGGVNVLFGSFGGLIANGEDILTDPLISQEEAYFGASLAAGDINGDGHDDLVVGSPGAELLGFANAGTASVLFGSPDGLASDGYQTIGQGLPIPGGWIVELPDSSDRFGYSLAIGDLDGDGFADLAVSAPYEDVNLIGNTGVVHIIFGHSEGLTAVGNQLWHQGLSSVACDLDDNDFFGAGLAAGDFDNDGRDDLAVGVPGETVDTSESAGIVHIFYGEAGGPTSGLEVWSQAGEVPGDPEDWDYFGLPLVAIRLDPSMLFTDGFDSGDLAAWSTSTP